MMVCLLVIYVVFFFKKKTAYEMRISDWSSDVCSSDLSNRLSGEITVTVAQVFANGTMLVRGQKQLTLNRGDEYIQISGLVRPADITPDNRVASTRVADAKIN